MKKTITLMLCLVLALSMAGCGAKTAGNASPAADGADTQISGEAAAAEKEQSAPAEQDVGAEASVLPDEERGFDGAPAADADGNIHSAAGAKSTAAGSGGTEDGEPASSADPGQTPAEEAPPLPEAGPDGESLRETKQTGGCWRLKAVGDGGDGVVVSAEDSKMISDMIAGCKYEIGASVSDPDYTFEREDGSVICYRSDCGTFHDPANDRSYQILDWQRSRVNELLSALVAADHEPVQEICDGVPLAPEGFSKP